MALQCARTDCQHNEYNLCTKDIVVIDRSNRCTDFKQIEKPYVPEYMRIVKFSGYAIIPPGYSENDVTSAIDASSGCYNGIMRHIHTEERITDWEYCENNDHPLNRTDAPIEIHEEYFKKT